MHITTIGIDLAKRVFQVHGADSEGRPVLRRKLRRGKVLAFFAGLPSCLVGMEACASAHRRPGRGRGGYRRPERRRFLGQPRLNAQNHLDLRGAASLDGWRPEARP